MELDKLVIKANEVRGRRMSTIGKEDGMDVDGMNVVRSRCLLKQASKKVCRPEIEVEVPLPRIRSKCQGYSTLSNPSTLATQCQA